jgi:uncharacterized protein (TIGR02453 family)
MSAAMLQPSVLTFLQELSTHNDRDWFNANKARYQAAYANFKAYGQAVLDGLSHTDELEGVRFHRIYRDIRFAKDKTPYKQHFSGGMARATVWRRGGYYFHIEPGASFIGGGFWEPHTADLRRIRQEIAADAGPLRAIIADPTFRETFGRLQGEQLKTAPQGFPKDHPNIDLLRYKQFLISRSFSDEEVLAPDFVEQTVTTFARMRPLFDYMSEVLTTDENGVPLAGLE